jgi:hypothetical protein
MSTSIFIGDSETGEVIKEVEENEKVIVVDYYSKQRDKLSKKHFYKVYKNSLNIISKECINFPTLVVMFRLIRLLTFGSQYVVINGIPANIEKICQYLKVERRTFENYVRKLEKLEILKRVKSSRSGREKEIMINPYFVSFGTATNEAINLFKNTKWYGEINRK